MTSVGITGHMGLSVETTALIRAAIDEVLASLEAPIEGWTSLAVGADQIFAEAVVAAGGSLVFVNPCTDLESTFRPEALPDFRALRAAAREVTMPFEEPSEEAFWAAGKAVADAVDLLIAVWDGGPSGGLGGTADVVAHRIASGRPFVRIWPERSARS